MLKKTGRMAVPVVEIDGNVIVGFDEVSLDEQLEG